MTETTTKSDIWSIGCTIIELLTGQPPYGQLTPMAAVFHMVKDDHPPLPEGISNVKNIKKKLRKLIIFVGLRKFFTSLF